jgi:hypothetical protein
MNLRNDKCMEKSMTFGVIVIFKNNGCDCNYYNLIYMLGFVNKD